MITIVTDSSVYISKEEAARYGIKVLPLAYNIAGIPFSESYIGANGNYENLIAKYGLSSKTSQTNMAVFLSTFEELIRKGHKVFCLTISSRLSGTYSSASLAARETGGNDIMVVDSLTTAGGLYFMAKQARRLFKEGKNMQQAAEILEKRRQNLVIRFSVDDMSHLRRSGRLGIVKQSVGTILNIRPILRCEEGSVVYDSVTRGQQEQIDKLIRDMPAGREQVVVHYIDNVKKAMLIAKAVEEKNLAQKVTLRKLGPVLGIHLGLGVVGVVWEND